MHLLKQPFLLCIGLQTAVSFSVLLPFIFHFKFFVLSITKFSFWYSSLFLLFLSVYCWWRNEITRVNRTDQRGKISKLLYSCTQLSRCWRGKSNNRELMKIDIREANRNLEDKMFLVSFWEYSYWFWISKTHVYLIL